MKLYILEEENHGDIREIDLPDFNPTSQVKCFCSYENALQYHILKESIEELNNEE